MKSTVSYRHPWTSFSITIEQEAGWGVGAYSTT